MWSEFGSPVNLTVLVYQYGEGGMPVVVAATSVAVPLVAEPEVGVLVSTVVVPPGAAQGKDTAHGSSRVLFDTLGTHALLEACISPSTNAAGSHAQGCV